MTVRARRPKTQLQFDVEKCETCGWDSVVIDSRPDAAGHRYRRRKCLNCPTRWTTYESRVHPRQFAKVETSAREIIRTTTSRV